jgi:hypothetical protein
MARISNWSFAAALSLEDERRITVSHIIGKRNRRGLHGPRRLIF